MFALRTFKKYIFFCGIVYASILIGIIIIHAIVYAILSITGNDSPPTLSLSVRNIPFYAGTQRTHLNSGKITWGVAPITDESYPLSATDVGLAIGDILASPYGWAATGPEFKLVEAATQPPDILFVLLPDEILRKICGPHAAACAENNNYDYIGVFPLELRIPNNLRAYNTGAKCYIFLGQYQPYPHFFVSVLGVLNHEVGHCMGLGHSSNVTDIMFIDGYNRRAFPSSAEVELIRQKAKK